MIFELVAPTIFQIHNVGISTQPNQDALVIIQKPAALLQTCRRIADRATPVFHNGAIMRFGSRGSYGGIHTSSVLLLAAAPWTPDACRHLRIEFDLRFERSGDFEEYLRGCFGNFARSSVNRVEINLDKLWWRNRLMEEDYRIPGLFNAWKEGKVINICNFPLLPLVRFLRALPNLKLLVISGDIFHDLLTDFFEQEFKDTAVQVIEHGRAVELVNDRLVIRQGITATGNDVGVERWSTWPTQSV